MIGVDRKGASPESPVARRKLSANLRTANRAYPRSSCPSQCPLLDPSSVRDPRSDLPLLCGAMLHGAALLAVPHALTVAVGLWWSANTVSHNFIHRPFCRRGTWNALIAGSLTLLLGFPQELWRQRHLAHHSGGAVKPSWNAALRRETLLTSGLWIGLGACAPQYLLTVYLPGFLIGQCLCAVHGHYEHARGTTSHYGRLYNSLFFNDGYHVEHHAAPGVSWRELPRRRAATNRGSAYPAVLRFCEAPLDALERVALRSRFMQSWLVSRHESAFRKLLPQLGTVRRVAVVGGGLFPRTVLVLQRVLTGAEVIVIDASAEHLEGARRFFTSDVECRLGWFDPADADEFDLVVIPLAYRGDREALYAEPPAPQLLVHDWIWNCRGEGARISPLLLKRVNLVQRAACTA